MTKVSASYLSLVVEPEVRRFCGPLFFTTSLETAAGNIHANGSFGLVDTGQRKILVTCHHVWNEFKLMRCERPDLQLGLSLNMRTPVAIKPEDFLIDEEKRCDLATFDMNDLLEVCAEGGCKFFNLKAHQSPPINVGDIVYFVGFPGKGRREEKNAVGFPRQPVGVRATQVGKFAFFSDASNLKLQADDFAGMSGCPCFVVPGEVKPIRLAGFTTGFSEGMGMLQFTYARYIRSDGSLHYMS